eukprot:4679317-Amphidinium_carterae.3
MAVKDTTNKELSQLLTCRGNKMSDHATTNQHWTKGHQMLYTFFKGNAFATHNCHRQTIHRLHNRRSQCLPQYSIDEEVLVQPLKECYHNHPDILWKMTKALYGLRISPKQWQEQLNTILQLGFTRLKSDACVFANK